jgi:hypothetical protein
LPTPTFSQIVENLKVVMVGLGRVELPTNGLGNRCSIRLSYRPFRNAQSLGLGTKSC